MRGRPTDRQQRREATAAAPTATATARRPGRARSGRATDAGAVASVLLAAARAPRATVAALLGDMAEVPRLVGHLDVPVLRLPRPLDLTVVLDPDLAEQVLRHSDEDLSVRWATEAMWPLTGQHSMGRLDGEPSRAVRRIATDALGIRQVAAIAQGAARNLAAEWRPGDELAVEPVMSDLARRIVGELLLGPDCTPLDVVTEPMTELFNLVDRFDWLLGRSRAAAQVRARELRATMDDTLRKLLHSSGGEHSHTAGPLRRMLDREHGEEAMIDTIISFLTVGAIGLSSTLAFALLECGRHPDWWPELAQGAASPLTRAVVDETLRLHNPTAILSRVAVRPVTFGSTQIRSGARVVLLPLVLNLATAGPDALAFRPARWIEGEGRERFPAFSIGPRRCPAVGIAPIVLATVLETLAGCVRIDSPPPPWGAVGLIARRPAPTVTCRVVRA